MIKIAFYDNYLGERGTTVALYDYAFYNKKLLNNESIIIYNKNSYGNCNKVIEKFKKEFDVFGISDNNNFSEVDVILENTKCDILYVIKSGEKNTQISKKIKTCIHCVFVYNKDQIHGNIYAAIAEWMIHKNTICDKFVPHMINLPEHNENLRAKLNIPENALIYGRYGGYHQFDIKYVLAIVYNIAKNNSNIYFLFANTAEFCQKLPNIIHIDKIIDLHDKVTFINTCDAMLWARTDGETFGLSIGEFCSKNKPIICTKQGALGHVSMLKEQAIWYDENNLYDILISFDKEQNKLKDWNAFKDFTPENVMKKFKQVFID